MVRISHLQCVPASAERTSMWISKEKKLGDMSLQQQQELSTPGAKLKSPNVMSTNAHPFITRSLNPLGYFKHGLRWGFPWHVFLSDGNCR